MRQTSCTPYERPVTGEIAALICATSPGEKPPGERCRSPCPVRPGVCTRRPGPPAAAYRRGAPFSADSRAARARSRRCSRRQGSIPTCVRQPRSIHRAAAARRRLACAPRSSVGSVCPAMSGRRRVTQLGLVSDLSSDPHMGNPVSKFTDGRSRRTASGLHHLARDSCSLSTPSTRPSASRSTSCRVTPFTLISTVK